jgi:hypothetical protein
MVTLDIGCTLAWSPWVPHLGCWRGSTIPDVPGLYRIRRVGQSFLDYVGQTGKGEMTLRKRLGMQRGIYAAEMPYTDPHTAAPSLWALRQAAGVEFEVSVASVPGCVAWRKGLEALAVALHRQEFGRSPTVNFGRMPAGFRKSSGNNRRLAETGRRFRGGMCNTDEPHHAPGTPPAGTLTGDPADDGWCGHAWSTWLPLDLATALPPPTATGLYRIRAAAGDGLLYIGEGLVSARLIAHWRKSRRPGYPQGDVFGSAGQLECSWVLNASWLSHQRLELECDLIGAHLLATANVPLAQFRG